VTTPGKRWFGPRPSPGKPHGTCGCCGCYGYAGVESLLDPNRVFVKYPRYTGGVKLTITLAGLPSVINFYTGDFSVLWGRQNGFDGWNGTYEFKFPTSQYGCFGGQDFNPVFTQPGGIWQLDNVTKNVLHQQSFDGVNFDGQNDVAFSSETGFGILGETTPGVVSHFAGVYFGTRFVINAVTLPIMPVFFPHIEKPGRLVTENLLGNGTVTWAALFDSLRTGEQSGNLVWREELWCKSQSFQQLEDNEPNADYSEVWDGTNFTTAGTWAANMEPLG